MTQGFDPQAKGDSSRSLRLRIPPNPLLGRMVRREILAFARRHCVDRQLGDFMFAIGEALANAFAHARRSQTIDVHCRLNDEQLLVTITDGGPGMNDRLASDFPDPHALTERGRGIPIMRSCADLIAVNSMPGVGTEVVLARYVTPRPA